MRSVIGVALLTKVYKVSHHFYTQSFRPINKPRILSGAEQQAESRFVKDAIVKPSVPTRQCLFLYILA